MDNKNALDNLLRAAASAVEDPFSRELKNIRTRDIPISFSEFQSLRGRTKNEAGKIFAEKASVAQNCKNYPIFELQAKGTIDNRDKDLFDSYKAQVRIYADRVVTECVRSIQVFTRATTASLPKEDKALKQSLDAERTATLAEFDNKLSIFRGIDKEVQEPRQKLSDTLTLYFASVETANSEKIKEIADQARAISYRDFRSAIYALDIPQDVDSLQHLISMHKQSSLKAFEMSVSTEFATNQAAKLVRQELETKMAETEQQLNVSEVHCRCLTHVGR